MSIESDFRAALLAHAPLAAVVAGRVALNAIQQGQPAPYVVFTCRREPQLRLDDTVAVTRANVEVQCWALTAVGAEQLADLVEAASAAGTSSVATVIDRATGYDAELALDATVLTVEWWG
jgi:hypothetical protein